MKQALINKFKQIYAVVAELTWRGFGLFLFVLGSSAGVGAALTGSWVNGVVVAWGTLMLGLIGALGYAIAVTGKATRDDVAKGAQDAIQKAQQDTKKQENK
jgi:protein-S-isoprenylcysteine O-methyltransferase Ste14